MSDTIVGVVWTRAASDPTQLAVIENERGRWLPMTTRLLADRVAALGLALAERGVGSGARVAVMVGHRAAWLESDLAVQAIGAVSAAVPPTDDDEALAEALQPIGAAAAIVEDGLAVARLRGLVDAGRLDAIDLIVPLVPGVEVIDGFADLVAEGTRLREDRPDAFEDLVAARRGDDEAVITYTAGAGGRPRPVVQTAGAAHAAAVQVAAARRLIPSDVTVVALDPAHPFERSVTTYPALISGAVLAYPEDAATIDRATHEVRPTFAHLPVERLRLATDQVQSRMRRNRGIKRLVARWWERSGGAAVRAGRRPSALARWLVGRPVLRTLGWDELRSLVVTGTAVPSALAETMAALGLVVDSGYAVVEAGGLVATGPAGADRTLLPLDGTNVAVSDGALTVIGPGLAAGYAGGLPLELGADGELLTGDLGRVEGGRVVVDGPAASRVTLPDGRQIVGADVERRLRESPYVGLAVVQATERTVYAAIEIDQPAVRDWAAERGLPFTTFASLVALDEVRSLVAEEVARLGPDVDGHEVVARPLHTGRDITRVRTTMYGRVPPAEPDHESTTLEQPSVSKESLS